MLLRGKSVALRPAADVKLVVESVLAFLLRVRRLPSISVSESYSVSGPSVSVPVSPSVADGVIEPKDPVDWLRLRSFVEVLSATVLRVVIPRRGIRWAKSFR